MSNPLVEGDGCLMGGDTGGPRRTYERAFGQIDDPNVVVHHLCGTRLCLNADHMTLMGRGEHTRHHNIERAEGGNYAGRAAYGG